MYILFRFCMVGDRLPNMKSWLDNGHTEPLDCTGESLRYLFCANVTGDSHSGCDEYFAEAYGNLDIKLKPAFKGIASGVLFRTLSHVDVPKAVIPFAENAFPKFSDTGVIVSSDSSAEAVYVHDTSNLYVHSEMVTSFIICVGVIFPSVTG